jgi:DNA repair exonuclease SbcCD ATPase subunit
MWIERLDIDGFGRLAGAFSFGPGLTLISGPNEAGKTTLQEALIRTMFGFSPSERRHRQGTSYKDSFAPWLHPRYGLVATLRDVAGRSLRVEWDFDEHAVTLKDADTGEDLSEKVRRARADVALGGFLLGLGYEDYCQVCCLDQTTLEAVERSDSLINALQEAVESIGSDVRVADADARLASFLSAELGVHGGHYGTLRGKALDRAIRERDRLTDELEACQLVRDDIKAMTQEMTISARQAEILETQLTERRQQLLRVRADETAKSVARATELTQEVDDQYGEAALLAVAVVDRAKTARARWERANEEVGIAEEAAQLSEPRLAELRAQERELQARVDGLSAYRDVDVAAEAEVQALQGRLHGLQEEVIPEAPDVPSRDPALEAYRRRRGELLAHAATKTHAYRRDVLAIAVAIAAVSLIVAVAVTPVAIIGVIGSAILLVGAGRQTVDAANLAHEFGSASLTELEARAEAEDRAVADAAAAVEQTNRRAAEHARAIEETHGALAAQLRAVGCESSESVEEAVAAYLAKCERAKQLRAADAELAGCRAAVVEEAESERELRRRLADREDVERELHDALQGCGVDDGELPAALAAFDVALRESDAALERAHSSAKSRAALAELLDGQSLDQLRAAADDAAQRLREHVAANGELPTAQVDGRELEQAVASIEARVRAAQVDVAEKEARIQERERDLAEPAELKVALENVRARIDRLELARDAVRIARATLADAARDAHRAFAPVLNAALEQNLPRITGDRYREVAVGDDLELTLVAPETGRQVSASVLSRGTQDQIFLVQRLELARMLDPTKGAAPLLLDDPFARSDPERIRLAVELLGEMAAGRQIIVFSEDPQLPEVARELCSDCHVVQLSAPLERAPVRETVG